jgi:uncharacterized protein YeaC (DUF1315 family)
MAKHLYRLRVLSFNMAAMPHDEVLAWRLNSLVWTAPNRRLGDETWTDLLPQARMLYLRGMVPGVDDRVPNTIEMGRWIVPSRRLGDETWTDLLPQARMPYLRGMVPEVNDRVPNSIEMGRWTAPNRRHGDETWTDLLPQARMPCSRGMFPGADDRVQNTTEMGRWHAILSDPNVERHFRQIILSAVQTDACRLVLVCPMTVI